MPYRAVNNLLGLAVLAVLAERPMHRYEMAAVIRERSKDRQLAVKWGSLYTVVDALARHGFVEVVGSGRDGARPEKTIYAITPAGATELYDWARQLLVDRGGSPDPFVAGLSVLAVVSPEETVALLEQRAADLRVEISTLQRDLDTADVLRLFLVEDEYALAVLQAQLGWVEGFTAELAGGTFAGAAEWRAGQIAGLPALLAPAPTGGGRAP